MTKRDTNNPFPPENPQHEEWEKLYRWSERETDRIAANIGIVVGLPACPADRRAAMKKALLWVLAILFALGTAWAVPAATAVSLRQYAVLPALEEEMRASVAA